MTREIQRPDHFERKDHFDRIQYQFEIDKIDILENPKLEKAFSEGGEIPVTLTRDGHRFQAKVKFGEKTHFDARLAVSKAGDELYTELVFDEAEAYIVEDGNHRISRVECEGILTSDPEAADQLWTYYPED